LETAQGVRTELRDICYQKLTKEQTLIKNPSPRCGSPIVVFLFANSRPHACNTAHFGGNFPMPAYFKPSIELDEAWFALESGFCLWVGAGLTKQILGLRRDNAPEWGDLTEDLERMFGLAEHNELGFPERLQLCWEANKDGDRNYLRQRLYIQICKDLLELSFEFNKNPTNFIPAQIREVAGLGQLANPLVSFNVEPLSSLLLGRPAGPVRILPYVHPAGQPVLHKREPDSRFQRLVYHPHGLVTGDYVMTKDQYKKLSSSLAFQLAIHAAFRNKLAIVGMSLDDQYLRDQIRDYRGEMDEILWFNSKERFNEANLEWARANRVTTVVMGWKEFWAKWADPLIDVRQEDLCAAWYRVIEEAALELEGGALGDLSRATAHFKPTPATDRLQKLAERLRAKGEDGGESGISQTIAGVKPSEILLKLRGRIQAAGYPIPSTSTTISH
jgi:hypothetical protein